MVERYLKAKGLLLLLFAALQLSARGELYSPVQFSVVTPLGTNGVKSGDYTNGVSVNLLVGVSRNEKYFTLSGISSLIYENAAGVQLACVSNHIGNTGRGCAVSGVANLTSSSYEGVQLSGLWNNSGGCSAGVMVSGLGNNARGKFTGLQVGGVLNIAGDVDGMQISGLMNKAKRVKGVQLATILNIADESDFPIGLVNVIKKGEMGLAVTYDLLGNVVASFRSGGRYTYGILGFGFNHKLTGGDKTVAEAGYGIHIPVVGWFRVDNEFKVASIGSMADRPTMNVGYLLAPSFKLWNHFNLFGGVSLNYFTSKSPYSESLVPDNSLWAKTSSGRTENLYVGCQAGLQYLF